MDANAMNARIALSINSPTLGNRGFDYINLAQAKVEPLTWWRHLELHPPYQFQIRAPYVTGTVTVNQGSAVVNGTGTNFDAVLHPGQIFQVTGDANYYWVGSVQNSTQLTLQMNYLGASQVGIGFQIANISYPFPATLSGHKIKQLLLQIPFIVLDYVDENEWSEFFPNPLVSTGRPVNYTEIGPQIVHVMPVPNQDYVCTARMQQLPRIVSGGQIVLDWPVFMHEALLKLAIAEGFRDRGDDIADDIESEAMKMIDAYVRQNNKFANYFSRLRPFDYRSRRSVILRQGIRVSGPPVTP